MMKEYIIRIVLMEYLSVVCSERLWKLIRVVMAPVEICSKRVYSYQYSDWKRNQRNDRSNAHCGKIMLGSKIIFEAEEIIFTIGKCDSFF
jgi:hypothetical protein